MKKIINRTEKTFGQEDIRKLLQFVKKVECHLQIPHDEKETQ